MANVPKFDDVDGFIVVQPLWGSQKLENQALGASAMSLLISKLGCNSVYFQIS
jgi:hypothetical protein